MNALMSPAIPARHQLPASPQLHVLPTPIERAKHLSKPQINETSDEFWAMWLQHQDYLYRFCLKWTNQNQTEASELLSLARDKAQAKWPKYAHKVTNAKSWLSSLTKHLYIDQYRARSRKDKIHTGIQKEASDAISHQSTPEANLLNQELETYLHQLVAALPENLRGPFVLRFLEDKSYKEIAFQLNLTEATVRKRIQYARQQLRKPLQQYLSGVSKATILTSSVASAAATTTTRENNCINQ